MHRVVSVVVEDEPGVLARVVSQFSRRNLNIADVVIRAGEIPGVSVITIAFDGDDLAVDRLVKSIGKLVCVITAAPLYSEPPNAARDHRHNAPVSRR